MHLFQDVILVSFCTLFGKEEEGVMQRLFHYLRLILKIIVGKQLLILLFVNQLKIDNYGKINFYRTDNYHHPELL